MKSSSVEPVEILLSLSAMLVVALCNGIMSLCQEVWMLPLSHYYFFYHIRNYTIVLWTIRNGTPTWDYRNLSASIDFAIRLYLYKAAFGFEALSKQKSRLSLTGSPTLKGWLCWFDMFLHFNWELINHFLYSFLWNNCLFPLIHHSLTAIIYYRRPVVGLLS